MYLLPVPQNIIYNNTNFILEYNTKILLNNQLGLKELGYAKILKENTEKALGFTLNLSKAPQAESKAIYLTISKDLKKEEYHLIIEKDGVTITGGNSGALLYGVQTLCQIINQEGAVLPGLLIKDYPELLNRGFYHDVTRSRIPTLKTLKALADKMSYYKLNQLQLYVEHSYLFKDFSEVWRDDTPLTAEEILELDAYCQSLNIELVPSVASFGHLYKALRTKTYGNLCELTGQENIDFSFFDRMAHHTVDVTNENSLSMVKSMLLEFIPLFSSGQFNLCADETFDLGKGKSKELADKVGVTRVYIDFLKEICEFIKAQGKRPMFWGDIILSNPEAIKELPEDVICLNWDYNTDVTDENVRKLYNLGVHQYLCPGVQGWKRFINRMDYAYENISRMCAYAHEYKAEGLLNTDWGDYGHLNHPEFSTTGMIYGASFSWNRQQIPFEELNRQISVLEYSDKTGEFIKLVDSIEKQEEFLWESVVEYKESCQKGEPELITGNPFAKEQFSSINKALELLDTNISKLYQLMTAMDSSKRSLIKPYLVAANGIKIFNQIKAFLGKYRFNVDAEAILSPKALAVKLEYWFMEYKELWRQDYKEGELFQLQDVINWYGDLLRDADV